jgi:hypothetical protein
MVFGLGEKEKKRKRIYIPVDIVERYASQGMSEHEIVSRLEAQGFKPRQINRALEIAIKRKVEAPPMPESARISGPVPMGERPIQRGYPPAPETREGRPRIETEPRMGRPPERVVPPGPRMLPAAPETAFTFEREQEIPEVPEIGEITVEEIVEGVVAEKWQEFEERLSNFERRDLQLQGQIEDLRKKIDEVEKSIKTREGTLMSRFGEFGESMENIEGRIGSIETVFKDFIPDLTESIRLLSTKKKRK